MRSSVLFTLLIISSLAIFVNASFFDVFMEISLADDPTCGNGSGQKACKQNPPVINSTVMSFTHEVLSPRDAASGLATGKRMHKPFVITKELDKSIPLLYKMIASGQQVQVSVVQNLCSDNNHHDCSITQYLMKNAFVNAVSVDGTPGKSVVILAFTYDKIVITDLAGKVSSIDDWWSLSSVDDIYEAVKRQYTGHVSLIK
jgi:type VI secretion system secreted protein Hcp